MLELKVMYDDTLYELQFEHSLLAVSKWEQKFKRPWASVVNPLTAEDLLEYYECMLLTDVDTRIVYALEPEQFDEILQYIADPATASSVPKRDGPSTGETITSELIYYWMTQLQIDWRAESWHLNRLMMLIQISNFKQAPPKKTDGAALASQWAEANERQKKLLGTTG